MATLIEFSSAAESTEMAGMVEIRATTLKPATTGARPAGARRLRPLPARRPFRPGFTLAELMVSVAVLLVLLTMVGWIFSTATKSSSIATAHNETMGNVRTAERQISQDLEGLIRNSFIGIWYQLTQDPTGLLHRTDRIVFFTSGDHSSIDQTDPTGAPVRSNIARVFLGQYYSVDQAGTQAVRDPASWILSRRSRLLNTGLPDPIPDATIPDPAVAEDKIEYERMTLQDWGSPWPLLSPDPLAGFFGNASLMDEAQGVTWSWMRRPKTDPATTPRIGTHMLFLPGCAEFKIQRWIERDLQTGAALGPSSPYGMPRWWPEEDIDGNGLANNPTGPLNSDFAAYAYLGPANTQNIREYFNGPFPPPPGPPGSVWSGVAPHYPQGSPTPWYYRFEQDVPKAIKITIRLFDPNKRMADGQVITMTFPLPH